MRVMILVLTIALFASPAIADEVASFYSLKTHTLEGKKIDLAEFDGKVALVVNVASRCGLTPQYEGLQKLYDELSEKGFTVLGFPSNDFMEQEPGTPADIRAFCDAKYGVTFPLFEKRSVKGEKQDALYQFLSKDLEEPSWNFTKYLVGKDGRVIERFDPRTDPGDKKLRAKIEAALAE